MLNQKQIPLTQELIEELPEEILEFSQYVENQSEFTLVDSREDKIEPGRSKIKTAIGIGALLLIALGLAAFLLDWFSPAASANVERPGPPPAPEVIASAQTITMSPHTTLPGTVVSMLDAVIASETSGKIISVV